MRYKTIFVAAGLAVLLGSSAFAQEAVSNGSFDGRLTDWDFSGFPNWALSHASNVGVVDTALPGSGSIIQSILLDVGQYTLSFEGFVSGAASFLNVSIDGLTASLSGSDISGVHSYTFDVAVGGFYDLVFSGTARGRGVTSFVGVDNVSISPVVAVPGPEAGAGLAGLALGGLMLWGRRRWRKSSAVVSA